MIKDPDLRERHLGDLEGLLFDEAPKINPESYKALRAGLNDLEIPVLSFSLVITWMFFYENMISVINFTKFSDDQYLMPAN